jgi:hypothetical protein
VTEGILGVRGESFQTRFRQDKVVETVTRVAVRQSQDPYRPFALMAGAGCQSPVGVVTLTRIVPLNRRSDRVDIREAGSSSRDLKRATIQTARRAPAAGQ